MRKYQRLTPHFHEKEFACPCCGELGDKKALRNLVNRLQILRNRIGKPITIVSGYRCPKYNEKCGGAKRSQHMNSMAADIRVKGLSTHRVSKMARDLFKAIGLYDTFTHVDTRATKAFWDFRTKDKKDASDKTDTKPSSKRKVRKASTSKSSTTKRNTKTKRSESSSKKDDVD